MLDTKAIAQYALAVLRVVERFSPFERAEIIAVAHALVQVDVSRELRRQHGQQMPEDE